MAARKTKIVATIGPACDSEATLRRMVEAGLDVARLNFSHGNHEEHGKRIRLLRKLAAEAGRPLAVLQDLQGPKIRTGRLAGGKAVRLKPGATIDITTREIEGTADRVSTTYMALPADCKPGAELLLDDGLLQLRTLAVEGDTVRCEVVVGGLLGEHKGINLPGTPVSAPALTDKDREDLAFGVGEGVDYVALSFVRRPEDVHEARELIRKRGGFAPVIAKIERMEAVKDLRAIMAAADGVMVARGDLGVETSSADVPLMQKDIIRLSGLFGMPDITATQMLQSMIDNPRPTRAEACDVANAVFDGTDAVMLSGETASGKYPVEAVRTMAEIAAKAETRLADFGRGLGTGLREERSVAGATAVAACVAAREVGAKVIACLTRSGRTATLVSQLRPEAAIVALTPSEAAYYRMALPWGVQAVRVPETPAEELSRVAERALRHGGWARPGDVVVLLTGDTVAAGATNTMRLMKIGG